MKADVLGVMRELFEDLDAAVPRDPDDQIAYARELFEYLELPGGGVEALEPPRYQRLRMDEVGTWRDDPWPEPTYGIDGSTTRPLEYTNGLVVDAAHAKTAVTGPDADRTIERTGHVTGVAYLDDATATLHGKEIETGHLTAELVPFPVAAEEVQHVSKSVSAVAQGLSESRQAVASLEAVDGALFLDGAVLPIGVGYWVLLDHAGERSPAGTWEVPERIVQNYVTVIDALYERDLPVIGVVKTSSMTQLLSALETKCATNDLRNADGQPFDLPWVRDYQFVAEVLGYDDLEYLTFTSWFVDQGQEIGGQRYDLLAPVADTLAHGTPDEYRRAFCYVRLPRSGEVFRIETPALFVADEERRQVVRLKALKEIAQRRGVPRAIHRADRLCRLSRENRDTIEAMLERSEAVFDYNWDGRWRDLTDDTDL